MTYRIIALVNDIRHSCTCLKGVCPVGVRWALADNHHGYNLQSAQIYQNDIDIDVVDFAIYYLQFSAKTTLSDHRI